MIETQSHRALRVVLLIGVVFLGILLAGCASGLFPQMTYQGRLTDENGDPLDGNVRIRFVLYHQLTGGTGVYTETETVAVSDGLFNTVVGPSSAVAGLTPEDLAEPLYLELQVANGVYTETLTPRQRLYGAPYAFTLMPGAIISSALSTSAAATTDAILTIVNNEDSNPLPVLRLEGLGGLEIIGLGISDGVGNAGVIYSHKTSLHSDIRFASNDEYYIDLDNDNNSGSALRVRNGAKTEVCTITEAGNLSCIGTKSAVVDVNQESRKLYAIESPEVWFEDFGSAKLENGVANVLFEPLFSAAVNLAVEYHVFLTPLGECNGLYVAEKTATGFVVRELGGGTASLGFDYRVVAKRAGYESERLELMDSGLEEEQP